MNTVELLSTLVAIPSVFPREHQISGFVQEFFHTRKIKFKTVSTSNRKNIIATTAPADSYLGFYAHMDTVPPQEGWDQAYQVTTKKNKAYGLGTVDMKGALAALLLGAEYASENNLPAKFIFGVDEENISQGAHDLVDSGLLNDVQFLIAGESGQVTNFEQDFSVCFGRKGRALYELTITTTGAHAAESTTETNAIDQALRIISALQQIRFPNHPQLGSTSLVMHSIDSHAGSFSAPSQARITFSLLNNPLTSHQAALEQFTQILDSNSCKYQLTPVSRDTPYNDSYEVDTQHPFIKTLQSKVFKPAHVTPMYTPSVADENVFANRLGIPVISLGPLGGQEHTQQEWLDLKSLDKVAAAYQEIIQLYAASSS